MTPTSQKEIAGLHELFIHGLADMYDAEMKLTKELPKMAKKSTNTKLKKAFEDHLEQTQRHVERLEKVFESLEMHKKRIPCKAIDGLLEEAEELTEASVTDEARDAALIMAAQKVEHYEIASYGTLCSYAEIMSHDEAGKLLHETLEEEKEADSLLSTIAEDDVNEEANDMPDDEQ